ncbi:MAG TPA: HNH endonuclease signature motif containing protein [Gemmatimonadales bacterium]|nr:HNH endonuclease signature motif containing protein [Gemmatimonadales bacterium]
MSDSPTLRARFEAKFIRGNADECWLWTAARDQKGYGRIGSQGRRRGPEPAQRVSYRLYVGPIPAGLHVLHHCDNPPCVNPAHLFVGTNADNMADMVRKDRQQQGERSGKAKLSAADVAYIRLAAADGPRGTQRVLARLFGVTDGQISHIVNGTSWRAKSA